MSPSPPHPPPANALPVRSRGKVHAGIGTAHGGGGGGFVSRGGNQEAAKAGEVGEGGAGCEGVGFGGGGREAGRVVCGGEGVSD